MRATTTAVTAVLGLALCLAAAGATRAEEMRYTATLAGATEVPAVDSAATGTLAANYDTDTRTLSWTVASSGLSGAATAAHFHGPARPGESAKPVVPVALDALDKGSATLTEGQAQQLAGGLWYFNIHTAAHPGGEIRGQVEAAQ